MATLGSNKLTSLERLAVDIAETLNRRTKVRHSPAALRMAAQRDELWVTT